MSYEKKLEVIRVRKLKRKLEYLRLELEEVDKMKKIQEVLKSETIINKEEKPNIVL